MATKVKIEGLDKLRKTFSILSEEAKKEITFAMERGANEVVNLAKTLVPVEDSNLRRSIGWTWGRCT